MDRRPLAYSDVVRWTEAPVATELDHEVVLMSLERGRCYGLGETGSAIWRRLEQPIRIEDLCAELASEYQGDPEAITADVLELLERLRDEGLVETAR